MDKHLIVTIFTALISGLFGAIIPIFLAPWWNDLYRRKQEIKHIKRSLNFYITHMNEPFKAPFIFGESSNKKGEKSYHISVVFSDTECSLTKYRFNKNVLLAEKDYKDILEYCYREGISHFDLEKHNKNYAILFKKKKYDFV